MRRAAAEALAQLPPASDVDEALTFALADESADVRASAARALGAHRAESARRRAGALRARRRAAGARVGVARARPASPTEHAAARTLLRRVADSRDPAAAVPALEALAQLDDRADDARFVARARPRTTARRSRRRRARSALRASTSPDRVKRDALAALERALVDPRWDVRRQAVLALADYGAVPLLWARRAHEQDPLVLAAIDRRWRGARGER